MLPIAVNIGFAGIRNFHEDHKNQIQELLYIKLNEIFKDIGDKIPYAQPLFCGISQLAKGSDIIFAEYCKTNNYSQRIYLPQSLSYYLNAIGSSGLEDFTAEDKQKATTLSKSNHIIQIRTVTSSDDRYTRFEETNLEILNSSDVIVCVVEAGAKEGKKGGTSDLLNGAKNHGIPLYVIEYSKDSVELLSNITKSNTERLSLIQLPIQFSENNIYQNSSEIPYDLDNFITVSKELTSKKAKFEKKRYELSVSMITWTHVIATSLAVIGVFLNTVFELPSYLTIMILLIELTLLIIGYSFHRKFHHSKVTQTWAVNRLISEIYRSINSIQSARIDIGYLKKFPFSERFIPLLNTLEVLYLKNIDNNQEIDVGNIKETYIKNRLEGEKGQLTYYRLNLEMEGRKQNIYNLAFQIFSLSAMIAIGVKVFFKIIHGQEYLISLMTAIIVIFPVVAVAIMSINISKDLEERKSTFSDNIEYLNNIKELLNNASTLSECQHLIIKSERKILAEVTSWFNRMYYRKVA